MFRIAVAFNLVCTGTSSFGKMFDFKKPKTEVSLVLRVDLDSKRWRFGDCQQTAAIHEIEETKIIFYSSEDEAGDNSAFVNRETGEYMQRTRVWAINSINLTQAVCEKSAFTGFPAKKFLACLQFIQSPKIWTNRHRVGTFGSCLSAIFI